ncbi:TasA family protein [Mesobacillus subterraneus]|uniref:Cell division protein FtsN n=1 Tax=Mesobacillus subterraneus TaxID=285983 RepID=A0A427TQT9_9BACI|nr:TasA family protein [Mesobacillus subterraneus]RSD26759.1 cell division protein FtsN [Mesobacillus subterraneus]
MSLKKKLGMGIATAALGFSLIGGGTFAYFNDTEQAKANFASGTIDLETNKEYWFDIDKLAPGDKMTRQLEIKNAGTLDIKKVLMDTSYQVTAGGDDHLSADDFAKQLKVVFLSSDLQVVLLDKTLYELSQMSDVEVSSYFFQNNRLPVGESDTLTMRVHFMDNGDQNRFQGDSIQVKFDLEAVQRDGVER